MADVYGALSEEDQEQVIAWIRKHWSTGEKCPICGGEDWELPHHVVLLPAASAGGIVMGGPRKTGPPGRPVSPKVQLICTNCGYTILFDALRIGLQLPGLIGVDVG